MRDVHLGHLAKAFALREAPATIKVKAKKHAAEVAAAQEAENRDKRKSKRTEGAGSHLDRPTESDAASDVESDSNSDSGSEAESEVESDSQATDPGSKRDVQERKPKGKAASMDKMLALAQAAGSGASRKRFSVPKSKARDQTAEARMYAAVRHLGKRSKKQGKLVASGADDFQIA